MHQKITIKDKHIVSLEVICMGKKAKMTPKAAARIQSAVDSGRAVKSDEGFKRRAMKAAARNSKRC